VDVTTIGTGLLSWHRAERVSDRYGSVNLYDGEDFDHEAPLDLTPVGQVGTLVAHVLDIRDSAHIGDLFRGFGPSTPEVGDVITLGAGRLFVDNDSDGTSVGLEPLDGRDSDWLDPTQLYRVHSQTVRLDFLPA
jgi:hypothetical protein